MSTTGAYSLIDIHTGRCYIGSSGNIERRLVRHIYELKGYTHHNVDVQNLWKDGAQFLTETYPTTTVEEARFIEKNLIDWFSENRPDLLLNIGLGVCGGDNLSRNPRRDAIISRMSTVMQNRMDNLSREERFEQSRRVSGRNNPMFGRTHTAEARAIMSAANKGNTYALGRKMSDDQRQALSIRASQRTGERNPFFGKQHSDETRRILSERVKARYRNGAVPANVRRVTAEGIEFRTAYDAARHLGVSQALVLYRIKNSNKDKYSSYHYLD